jgi:hypothetical protein
MSNITVNIPYRDRELWIRRIEQRISEADAEAERLYKSNLDAFNNQHWLVKWFFGPAPTMSMAKRQALNGVGTLKMIKDMLQTTGWETMSIDGWVFRWLKGCDDTGSKEIALYWLGE